MKIKKIFGCLKYLLPTAILLASSVGLIGFNNKFNKQTVVSETTQNTNHQIKAINNTSSVTTTMKSDIVTNGITADDTISGFSPRQLQQYIGSNQASQESELLSQFLFNNRHNIFDNITDSATFLVNKDSSNVYGKTISFTATSITFNFSVNSIYVDNNQIIDWNDDTIQNFTITINGLNDTDTNLKEEVVLNGIQADQTISRYSPKQIALSIGKSPDTVTGNVSSFITNHEGLRNKDTKLKAIAEPNGAGITATEPINTYKATDFIGSSINSNKDGYTKLKKWVYDHRNEIFENLPADFPDDSKFGLDIEADSNSNNSILVTIRNNFKHYANGQLVVGEDQKSPKFKITGFLMDNNTTLNETVAQNGIAAASPYSEKAPYEFSADYAKNFIIENQNSIFENIVQKLRNENVNVISCTVISSTVTRINVSIPVYADGRVTNKEFQFNVTGLTDKDTKLKAIAKPDGQGVTATNPINSYRASVFVGSSITVNSERYAELKKWVYDNRNQIFENLPNDFPNDSRFGLEIEADQNSNNSILVKIGGFKYYANGSLANGKSPQFKITGFLMDNTTLNETVAQNGIAAASPYSEKAPYEFSADDAKNFIIENQNSIFENIVQTLRNENVNVISCTVISSTVTRINVSIPVYADGSVTNKEFQFNVTGLTDKDTKLKAIAKPDGQGVTATNPINSYRASELIGSGQNNNPTQYNNLKKWVYDNRDQIFENLPNDFPNDGGFGLEIVADPNSNNSILVKIGSFKHYANGSLVESSKSPQFKITGFLMDDTTLNETVAQNGIAAASPYSEKAPYEFSADDAKSFIVENQNRIFESLPQTLEKNNITNVTFSATSSTSVQISATIPSYVNGDVVDKEFQFNVTGLTDKDTTIKQIALPDNLGLTATYPINDYRPIELIGSNQNNNPTQYNNLKKWVYSNRNEIFEYLPNDFPNDGGFGLQIEADPNSNNSILVKIGNNFKHYANGQLVDGSNQKSPLFKISGLKTVADTTLNETVSQNGIAAASPYSEKAPYEFSADDAKSFILENQNSIFESLPQTLDNDNITNVTCSAISSTSVQISATIPSYVNGDVVDKEFQFNVTGLTDKDTRVNPIALPDGVGITATEPINTYKAIDFIGSSTTVNDVPYTKLKKWVYDHREQIFENLPGDFPDDGNFGLEIEADPTSNSSIIVNLKNGFKHYENGQLVDTDQQSPQFKIRGFVTETTEFIYRNPLSDSSFQQYVASSQTFSEDQIQTFLNSKINELFAPLPDGATIIIQPDSIVYSPREGSITLSISPSKYFDQSGNETTTAWFNEIQLTGFKIQSPTRQVNTTKSDTSLNSQIASSFTNQNASEYLNNNKTYFFENLPSDVTFNITSLTSNNNAGSVEITFTLSQHYNDDGILVDGSDPYTITVSGFKTTGLTTNVPSTMALSGVSNILASDVTDSQSEIISAIVNGNFITSTNGELGTSDLSFTVVANTADNVNQQVKINLSINNNKYWVNGTSQSTYSCEITLTGFKQQLPTEQIKTTESNHNWSNQSANSFTQENALTYINSNKDSFFTNLPDNTTLTITNFTPNSSTGQITFNVNLNQYYNDKGILVQENKTYSITFRGFQTTGLTTNVPSTMALSGVSNILASDVTNNQSNIITAIIDGGFITSTNGTLQTSDLSFTVVANTADNVNRQVKINLSIKNNKYWENGTPQSTYSRQVTLTGFKQQKASSFNAPLDVSGNDIEEQRQNLINGINDGSINLANSPYYIPDANADGAVNMNDINITEENGQLVITPKKIYNNKGILTDNTTGQKITVARPSSDPTYSNPTSSEKKWEGWMIIVIVCSIIGAIFLIILFALLGRYLSNKRHMDDASEFA